LLITNTDNNRGRALRERILGKLFWRAAPLLSFLCTSSSLLVASSVGQQKTKLTAYYASVGQISKNPVTFTRLPLVTKRLLWLVATTNKWLPLWDKKRLQL